MATGCSPRPLTALRLFFADNLYGPWVPHPANREERYGDPGSYGRGAGRILQRDGRLYRPIQGNFEHYGESVIYNEITELSESRFDETEYCRIAGRNIHHLASTEGLLVIDANSEKCNPFFEREEASP